MRHGLAVDSSKEEEEENVLSRMEGVGVGRRRAGQRPPRLGGTGGGTSIQWGAH